MIREIQHFTGELCPQCLKDHGMPCAVLHKNDKEFYCMDCGFTAPLIAHVPEMLFELSPQFNGQNEKNALR
jgi:predicted RNA-binding Zn-ribbon protein involved in translation (DUF1610 family)